MNKEQIEKIIQDTFTEFKGSDRGAMVLACRQLFETYYTPLEASHRELIEAVNIYLENSNPNGNTILQTALSNAKKFL